MIMSDKIFTPKAEGAAALALYMYVLMFQEWVGRKEKGMLLV